MMSKDLGTAKPMGTTIDVVHVGRHEDDVGATELPAAEPDQREPPTVRTVSTVDETLHAIEARRPDVLVVEHALPAGSGFDVLHAVTKRWPELPIVYYTARPDGEIAAEASQVGISEYVHEAVLDEQTLLDRARAVVAGSTEQDEVSDPVATRKDALKRLYSTVAMNESVAETIDDLLSLAMDVFETGGAVLSRIEGGEYTIEHVQGFDGAVEAGETLPLSATFCERTIAGKAALQFGQLSDAPYDLAERALAEEFGIECYVGTPVIVDGEPYGTFCLFDREPRSGFDEWEVTFIELLATWVSRELERERREQERDTADSELREVFDRVDDGFFGIDNEWQFTYLNARAESLLQRDAEELIGQTVWEEFPEAITRAFYERYHRAMETQEPVDFEEYFPPLGIWFQVRAYPSDTGLSVYFEDVTERKEREQELERYERVFENVSDMIAVLDENDEFVLVTPSLVEKLGYDRGELIGAHVSAVAGETTVEESYELGRALVDEPPGSTRQWETEIITADGDLLPVELEFSLLETDAGGHQTLCAVRDISELADTREELADQRDRFQYLFEYIPDPVVEVEFVDGEPVVRSTNSAFTDVFGHDQSAIEGRSLNELILLPGQQAAATDLDEEAIEGNVQRAELRRLTVDGPRQFLFRGLPYDTGEEGVWGFGIYTDISEQKRHEQQLQVLNRILRHNLRNDLNVVIGLAEHLAADSDDPESVEQANELVSQARSLVDLGDKARQTERVLDPETEVYAEQARSLFDGLVREYGEGYDGLSITTEFGHEEPFEIDRRVRIAVDNLVENAIEHNDGPVSVTLRTAVDEEGRLRISVEDDGTGIPKTERSVLSGEQEITPLSHGSGLGLWLVVWVAQTVGGEVEFGERPDGGSIVTLTVPHRQTALLESGESAGESRSDV